MGTLLATALVYVFIDILPLYRFFPSVEPQILQILWQSLLWGAHSFFVAFFICYGLSQGLNLQPKGFVAFFKKYFSEFLATRLRIVIHSTLWFLLLIIPGFVMMLKYSLGEMAVFFSPNFLDDRTQDPLTISSKKIGFKVGPLLFLAIFYFIVPAILDTSFDHAHLVYEPSGRIIQILIYTFLIIITYIYLYWTFSKEKKNV